MCNNHLAFAFGRGAWRTTLLLPHLRLALTRCLAFVLAFGLLSAQPAAAYSVLSHEQVVDLAWKTDLVPLLLARYPDMTPDQIKEAHAYAYGGAIIQDIGYYPFGSHVLSDLLHYVRSGDFVVNLLRESSTPNEFAFALGALAHYTSDSYGHPAVNHATANEFPKLRERFGPVVTYDDDPRAHLQTEFGFDVLEVAQQHYAPEAYHDFIGFQVDKPVFERAFRDTYGLELVSIMTHEDLAISTYRHTVSNLIPSMTTVAIADYGKQIQQADPMIIPKHLIYRLNRAEYQKTWGRNYQRPSARARFFAFILRHLPKIGPLNDLSLRIPKPEVQHEFLTGLNTVVDNYHQELAVVRANLRKGAVTGPTLPLPNRDLDTGKPTAAGEYRLVDQTYARYLALVTEDPKKPVPDDVRANLLAFYASAPVTTTAKKPKQIAEIEANLAKLHNSLAGGPTAAADPVQK